MESGGQLRAGLASDFGKPFRIVRYTLKVFLDGGAKFLTQPFTLVFIPGNGIMKLPLMPSIRTRVAEDRNIKPIARFESATRAAEYPYAVAEQNEPIARFKTPRERARWLAFMQGEIMKS